MQPNIENLKRVYEMLEDEESRFTYLKRLDYLVTGKIEFMESIITRYLPELTFLGRDVIVDFLNKLPDNRDFVLFGAGIFGGAVLPLFKNDKRFIGFCSSTKSKQKNGYLGYPVMSPEELFTKKDLTVIVSVSSAQPEKEILDLLQTNNYPSELVFTLSDFQPRCNDRYFGVDFMTYEESEIFVDAGCYDLETSLKFRQHCKNLKKVYAFEPDSNAIALCKANMDRYGLKNVELVPYGVWSEDTVLHFTVGKGKQSYFDEEGEETVAVKAIDHVVNPEEKITYIKMDVEGSELEALKGARETILSCKPKLAICIYHKPEDMTEIPLYIHSLVPEYKFYVRHHSNCYLETVLYAVL